MRRASVAIGFQRYRDLRAGKVPAKPARKHRVFVERRERIAAWLSSRYFGASRQQVFAAFDEYYPNLIKHGGSERKLHRDLKVLVQSGKFVRVGNRFTGTKIIRANRASIVT